MKLLLAFVGLFTLGGNVLASSVSAQQIGSFPGYEANMLHRVDRGLILTWKANHSDSKDEIRAYDMQGRLLAHFGVLGLVPEAKTVSVWDVAAKPGEFIAVAAVYAKPNAVQNELLLFDFNGKLMSAFVLAPSRGIARLAIDDNLNIWTLTESSGDQSPDAVPMVVEYNSSGKEIRDILKRSEFPPYQQIIRVSAKGGHPNLGVDGNTLWFWLPESKDLVTVNTETAEVSRMNIGGPALESGVYPSTLYRLSDASYVSTTLNRNSGSGPSAPAYTWSQQSRQWGSAAQPGSCGDGYVLWGVWEHKALLLGRDSGSLCTASF